jgi:hypothetical protein
MASHTSNNPTRTAAPTTTPTIIGTSVFGEFRREELELAGVISGV